MHLLERKEGSASLRCLHSHHLIHIRFSISQSTMSDLIYLIILLIHCFLIVICGVFKFINVNEMGISEELNLAYFTCWSDHNIDLRFNEILRLNHCTSVLLIATAYADRSPHPNFAHFMTIDSSLSILHLLAWSRYRYCKVTYAWLAPLEPLQCQKLYIFIVFQHPRLSNVFAILRHSFWIPIFFFIYLFVDIRILLLLKA